MNSILRVRLVDDDLDLLRAQMQSLKIAGFEPEGFSDPLQALEGIDADFAGVILTDVMMPQMDGFEFFSRLRAIDPELPVILLTGHGDVAMAVKAMQAGAWDFLTKPVGLDALSAALRRAAQARSLVLENRRLRKMRAKMNEPQSLLGQSTAITRLREAASRLGEAGIDVLITGPSGAGKEALARTIHQQGQRRARAFVHVACDMLTQERAEGELFGDPAQSARHGRISGYIEKAHRATLYLDRVEMLPLPVQARLLHIIESRSYWVAGSAAPRALDMHVMAASSVDLPQWVREGRFNGDLYYRLSGVALHMPPLAERRADILPLYRAFLLEACERYHLPLPELTALTRVRLDSHDWPGNARELRQFAEAQALGLSDENAPADSSARDLPSLMANYEASLLREALRATKGNVTKAMAQLNLPRKTFYDKLSRHGIQPETFRDR